MKSQTHNSITILICLALSACAVTTEQCDPRNVDASLANKFNCNSQGVYAQRVQEKEKILLNEQQANAMFREVYEAIEEQQSQVGKELSAQQNAYGNLSQALTALLEEIKRKSAGNQKLKDEIDAIEKDLVNIDQQEDPSVLQQQLELQQLRNRVAQLESDLGLD
jgi:septation ring formation regulator EzrA